MSLGRTPESVPAGPTFDRRRNMKRFSVLFAFLLLAGLIGAAALRVGAQGGPTTPEARAKQNAIEAAAPKLNVTEERLPLMIPGHTIGETEGVAMNSKKHLFVY